MADIVNLLSKYSDRIANMSEREFADPAKLDCLLIGQLTAGSKLIKMVYAPFDHINPAAKLVIVGMTPGRQQASNALTALHRALHAGLTLDEAGQAAKVVASFSGPMRSNLVRMLDFIGVNRWLEIPSTGALWEKRADLAHFTSALRYPVFSDGQNWSGQPDMIAIPRMRQWLEDFTGAELASLKDALLVPLGTKVAAALHYLADIGSIDRSRILDGLPHPSGANAERIAYFLHDKPADRCSAKTNTSALDTARTSLRARVESL